MLNHFKLPIPSYRRNSVSCEFKGLWTSVFSGVTKNGIFARDSLFSQLGKGKTEEDFSSGYRNRIKKEISYCAEIRQPFRISFRMELEDASVRRERRYCNLPISLKLR
jgi:hypothetical protein